MKRSYVTQCRRLAPTCVFVAFLAGGCAGGSGSADSPADDGQVDSGEDVPQRDEGYSDERDRDLNAPDIFVSDVRDSGPDEKDSDPAGDEGFDVSDGTDVFVKPDHLPESLPIEYTRQPAGEPLTEQEIRDFTYRYTGFLKNTRYFKWVKDLAHGVDASTGQPDWAVWWQDIQVRKEGDKLTIEHGATGGAHNIMIATPEILSGAAVAYIEAGDADAGKVTEQFCKGITATMKGFVHDDEDPNIYLMARNFVAQNHEWTIEWQPGVMKRKAVDFTGFYSEYSAWNAERFEYVDNPYWGDVWVTNLRSKDDVCHMFRTFAFLPYIVKRAPDQYVKTACQETVDYMRGFTKDIVDWGYNIRTKDRNGNAYLPGCEDQKDLSSFACFTAMDPQNECTARVASDLIAYGEVRDNSCVTGYPTVYDQYSQITHCFNYHINENFHMAAVANALTNWELDTARNLMTGLEQRVSAVLHPSADEPGPKNCNYWNTRGAVFIAQSGAIGLPLTAEEVRHVHAMWDRTMESFLAWGPWDLWADGVPDGLYGRSGQQSYTPFVSKFTNDQGKEEELEVSQEKISLLLEYCFSPLVNPAGVMPVDCSIIRDPQQWGGPSS